MDKGTGRWAVLVVASFMAHTALTVNSTETALWNEQGRHGALLAQQLADAAAPLALARDMVSLSVLANRYENRPGVAGVRLYNPRNELLAETGDAGSGDRPFTAWMQVQQQALGRVDLRLTTLSRSDIVRRNISNIGLSALLHALLFATGLLAGSRRTQAVAAVPQQSGIVPARNVPPPAPPAPVAVSSASATLLHIALDDPNGLLGRVSAGMADELLSLFDQFIDRAARLYGGDVDTPFGIDGVLVRFNQADPVEREFQALAAGQLFMQLVRDSMEERRNHGRLCLECKAGVLHGGTDATLAALLARTAPAGRLLSNLPGSPLGTRCRLGTSFRLAATADEAVSVALIEGFAPEYQQLISNQSQQILGPAETA